MTNGLQDRYAAKILAESVAAEPPTLPDLSDAGIMASLAECALPPDPSDVDGIRAVVVARLVQDTADARLPRVEDGCACHWWDSNPLYGPPDVEYEPACPVHSIHLYDPRAGVWVLRTSITKETP